MAMNIRLAVAALGVALLGAGGALAQDALSPDPSTRQTLWDLQIGLPAAEQPHDLQEYACGTNGGPPSLPIGGFADYATCPAEAETGLHEVQFRYDDELELWARAHELQSYVERYGGTRLASWDVIVSALFDDAGVLRGIRAVTDDRVPLRQRLTAYQMAGYLKSQLGSDLWHCSDLPTLEGETPVATGLIKENCRATTSEGMQAVLETRLLRRPGQSMIDPHSGEARGDRFVASTRFELLDAAVPLPAHLGEDR